MQEKELLNFIPFNNIIPWRRSIMYIDTTDYYADEYFIQNYVPIRFKSTWAHQESPFVFVFCTFNKKHIPKIAESLDLLDRRLTIKYGQRYLQFKEDMNNIFDGLFDLETQYNNSRRA